MASLCKQKKEIALMQVTVLVIVLHSRRPNALWLTATTNGTSYQWLSVRPLQCKWVASFNSVTRRYSMSTNRLLSISPIRR